MNTYKTSNESSTVFGEAVKPNNKKDRYLSLEDKVIVDPEMLATAEKMLKPVEKKVIELIDALSDEIQLTKKSIVIEKASSDPINGNRGRGSYLSPSAKIADAKYWIYINAINKFQEIIETSYLAEQLEIADSYTEYLGQRIQQAEKLLLKENGELKKNIVAEIDSCNFIKDLCNQTADLIREELKK
ncbi:MAG: hypothetical protein ABH832_01590 [bacterium]